MDADSTTTSEHDEIPTQDGGIEEYSLVKELRSAYGRLLRNDQHKDDSIDALETSYIGCSLWTGTEKRMFFENLTRHGKSNALTIAEHLGTKTTFEVSYYLKTLEEKCVGLAPIESVAIPGASEISTPVDNILSSLALQACHDWNCDDDEDIQQATFKDSPSASLLNLRAMLELSTMLFMNSGDLHENWRTIAQKDELPALTVEALLSLTEIVTSIVKCLVETTLTIAEQRERAQERKIPKVWPSDVTAALDVMGLRHPEPDYWMNSVKRMKISILQETFSQDTSHGDVPLSYEAAKDLINGENINIPTEITQQINGTIAQDCDIHREGQSPTRSTASEHSSFVQLEETQNHHIFTDDDLLLDSRGDHIESFDITAARAEESRLRQFLGIAAIRNTCLG